MLRHVPLLVLVLPGCLVSFNDYPVGDIHATEPTAGTAASSSGTTSGGGSGNAASGTDSGGSMQAIAGTETGGTDAAPEGGAPTDVGAAGAAPADNRNLIDDFEDEDEAIFEVMGRSGAWYVGNDGRGTQTPKAGSPLLPTALDLVNPMNAGSTRGVHTFGGPFYDWGALIGTALAVAGDNAAPYDLSPFTGMKLWVRSASNFSGGGGWTIPAARQVRFNLPTVMTGSGPGCTTCDNDHFGVEIPLTSKWVQVEVPFSSLKQGGFGKPAIKDLRKVLGVELLFPKSVTFDLWVDDLELY